MVTINGIMNLDPGIICYQHCHAKKKVFSFVFHEICDLCHLDISNAELRIPPFRIPYPFKDASQEFNSIVIKPTIGDFLKYDLFIFKNYCLIKIKLYICMCVCGILLF